MFEKIAILEAKQRALNDVLDYLGTTKSQLSNVIATDTIDVIELWVYGEYDKLKIQSEQLRDQLEGLSDE